MNFAISRFRAELRFHEKFWILNFHRIYNRIPLFSCRILFRFHDFICSKTNFDLQERHTKTEELLGETQHHYDRVVEDMKTKEKTLETNLEAACSDASQLRSDKTELVDMNENLSNQISEQLMTIKKLQDHEQVRKIWKTVILQINLILFYSIERNNFLSKSFVSLM